MLIYNFKRIFKARGVDKPYGYLRKLGISESMATRLKADRISRMNLSSLEKLCAALHCTPNDLMEWIPDSNNTLKADHPLYSIRRSDKIVDITQTLLNVPFNKLEKVEQLIQEVIKSES